MEKSIWMVLAPILLCIAIAVASTAYLYLYKKDYNFTLEAKCDPTQETCFFRDCSEEDSCPPNNLENYKIYNVSARDFSTCTDNSCATECASGSISCTQVKCGDGSEDTCSADPEESSQ